MISSTNPRSDHPLRRIRKSRGLSLTDLAILANVGRATIYRIEVRLTEPQPRTLKKLAKALCVAIDDLLEEEIDQPTLNALLRLLLNESKEDRDRVGIVLLRALGDLFKREKIDADILRPWYTAALGVVREYFRPQLHDDRTWNKYVNLVPQIRNIVDAAKEVDVGSYRRDEAMIDLFEAVQSDFAGDHKKAMRIGKKAVARPDEFKDPSDFATATIHVATFYDHAGRSNAALKLINGLDLAEVGPEIACWIAYQKGLLLRRAAEDAHELGDICREQAKLEEAREVLDSLRIQLGSQGHENPMSKAVMLSCHHQLGVIYYLLGKYAKGEKPLLRNHLRTAVRLFEYSIRGRQEDKDDHRIIFSHRRLALTYAAIDGNDEEKVVIHFKEAISAAKQHEFGRYLQILERDVKDCIPQYYDELFGSEDPYPDQE